MSKKTMAKWYQKASVQTALVSGVIVTILSLSGGIFSLYKENIKLKGNIQSEIESSIDSFIKEMMHAAILINEIDLKPELMTLQETSETLTRINKESSIKSNIINIFKIHRMVKKYGKKETDKKLGKLINTSSSSHKEFLEFVLTVSEKHNRFKRLDDVGYVNDIYHKYVTLINKRNTKRDDLHTYIANLTVESFDL
jgi:hypothetical protein